MVLDALSTTISSYRLFVRDQRSSVIFFKVNLLFVSRSSSRDSISLGLQEN
jgi:hypothetical protein